MASIATEISVVITVYHTGMVLTTVKCAPWVLFDPKKPPRTGWRLNGLRKIPAN